MAHPIPEASVAAARAAAVAAVDAAGDELVALAKFIHANPEVALEEVRASAAGADFLEGRGFAVERGVAELPTAFVADTGDRDGEPRVAFLAEYDALPGLGHGCGHNLIAISNVGAGLWAKAALEGSGGTTLVIGTPAEEGGGNRQWARKDQPSPVNLAISYRPPALGGFRSCRSQSNLRNR